MTEGDDHDRLLRVERDVEWMRENLKLQAQEYERRLSTLNHAHERAQETARTFVTQEKYDDYVKSQEAASDQLERTERETREKALERFDERFAEFVKRYEERHEVVQQAITLQRGAVEASEKAAAAMARRLSAAVGIAGLFITIVVLLANHVL